MTLAGLLLAGGRSSRFGSDKALAVVEGETLLQRAERCLRASGADPLVVASGDGRSRPGVGDRQVADLVADAGPLSAIAAGIRDLQATVERVAVLAVDHVAPSADLLRLLAAQPGRWSVALAVVDGHRQPLHAVWATTVAEELVDAVTTGERSVLRWLGTRDDVLVLEEDDLVAAGIAPAVVRDADRPADLPPTSGRSDT